MGIADIIQGHTNELLGLNKDMKKARLAICERCPLYKMTIAGPICNSKLWLDVETGDVSLNNKPGYKRGCGCRILAKATLSTASCPAGKW